VLERLLRAGAPVNLKGLNDWTPAHMAAARDDVEVLRLLVAHGADLTIRTTIDDYATPLEEVRTLGQHRAAAFLESLLS
jgi:ankyrin repeat protein